MISGANRAFVLRIEPHSRLDRSGFNRGYVEPLMRCAEWYRQHGPRA